MICYIIDKKIVKKYVVFTIRLSMLLKNDIRKYLLTSFDRKNNNNSQGGKVSIYVIYVTVSTHIML